MFIARSSPPHRAPSERNVLWVSRAEFTTTSRAFGAQCALGEQGGVHHHIARLRSAMFFGRAARSSPPHRAPSERNVLWVSSAEFTTTSHAFGAQCSLVSRAEFTTTSRAFGAQCALGEQSGVHHHIARLRSAMFIARSSPPHRAPSERNVYSAEFTTTSRSFGAQCSLVSRAEFTTTSRSFRAQCSLVSSAEVTTTPRSFRAQCL